MALKIHNTLSREIEIFEPINPDRKSVGLYTCGPTVYNFAHIGNFRAYIFGDIVKRTLSYSGYEVRHIMNLTDVDDKTIRDSQKNGQPLSEFTDHYANEFIKDSALLNILPPTEYTKATDNILEMLELVEKLLKSGYAYKSEDGSVYFDVHSDKEYGQLSKISFDEEMQNASGRIKSDEYEKDNASDFALWKAWDEADGDVFWEPGKVLGHETSIGRGRPGWHIECSAMSMKYLGDSFDIHTGGIDLIFPHHENEIAQSECATGKKFVKYWLHNEWVLVEGKKMSKSAGNFVTLRTITDKGINPLAFRLWTLMGHYRTPTNFNWDTLEGCESALKRLHMQYLEFPVGGVKNEDYTARFLSYISNDFDTPRSLALIWELMKDENVSAVDKRETLLNFDKVLGLGFANVSRKITPQEVIDFANEREKARKEKNWVRSDELRNEIDKKGYKVLDTQNGPVVEEK